METAQAKRIRQARALLDVTTEELAERLGRPLSTVRAWILPKTSAAHRTMPDVAAELLERIVTEAKRRKRKA